MAKREYLLILVEEDISRLNGSVYWRLTFMDIDDFSVWETTVDGSYRNFARSGWDHIVGDPNPWGIYTGLKRSSRETRRGNGVITADSRPVKTIQIESHEEVEKIVEGILELIQRRRRGGGDSTYGSLFH